MKKLIKPYKIIILALALVLPASLVHGMYLSEFRGKFVVNNMPKDFNVIIQSNHRSIGEKTLTKTKEIQKFEVTSRGSMPLDDMKIKFKVIILKEVPRVISIRGSIAYAWEPVFMAEVSPVHPSTIRNIGDKVHQIDLITNSKFVKPKRFGGMAKEFNIVLNFNIKKMLNEGIPMMKGP